MKPITKKTFVYARGRRLAISITLFVLLLAGNTYSLKPATHSPLPVVLGSVTGQGAVQFSSTYTALTKCGSGMTRKEEREAEQHGSDIPTHCRGYGGYAIDISYSACASMIRAEKGADSILLATQAVGWKQKTVEWRLANGKPFAVIMRVYEYGGNDFCTTDGKIIGESLIVKGLKGYEQINEEVKVKGTPNANVRARELADKGYAKGK